MSKESKQNSFSLKEMWDLIWPLVSQHRNWLLLVMLATPLGVLSQTFKPLILQQTIDGPLTGGDLKGLSEYCAIFMGIKKQCWCKIKARTTC
mgnify:CR=1 FL=1